MSTDRFVTFLERKPSRKAVADLLGEFLGSGFALRWDSDRWFISVPGEPPEKIRVGPRRKISSPYRRQRFIEVIPMLRSDFGHLSVLTRQADPLVGAIADGIVRFMCFRFHGDSSD